MVARVLDVPEKTGATIEQTLLDWLRPRQLLLILDNCEHLVDACAAFAESVLRHASELRILATSREALNVPGEAVWRVPPLAVPAESETVGLDEMLGFDAIRLFADRAAAVASFQITQGNITDGGRHLPEAGRCATGHRAGRRPREAPLGHSDP